MQVSQDQLDLIARVYDVVLEPQAWPEVLQDFSDQVRARGTNLIVSDHAHPEVRIASVSSGAPVEILEEYTRDWAHYEAPAMAKLLTYPARSLVPAEDLTGPSENLPRHGGFGSEPASRPGFACGSMNHPAWVDALTINLGDDRPENLTSREVTTCGLLLPHMAKAVEVSRPFQLLQARFRAALAAVDRLQLGVLILNERGQVAIKNREACRILELDDGLSVDHTGRPHAGAANNAELQAAIKRAVATARAQGQDREAMMMVRRRSGVDPFIVEVSPLHTRGGVGEPQLRGALALVDPTHRSVVSTRGMEQLYDLTEAEARVLSLLVEGFGNHDIADQRNTSPETVRSQVKAVYSKTGLKTRAALVRLALAVNLPVDAPDPLAGPPSADRD